MFSPMLHRPALTRSDATRLLPLATLCGALLGLLAGALTSRIPALLELGTDVGRFATILGAGIGGVTVFLLLARARWSLLSETAFRFEQSEVTVTWPGFEARVPWSEVEDLERLGANNLRLSLVGGGRLVLFGLAEPEQIEALIRTLRDERLTELSTDKAA